jgi:hypothetical protein
VIDMGQTGLLTLGRLLPDDSQLGLWEFGLRFDPPRDYRVVLPSAALSTEHRFEVGRATERLRRAVAAPGSTTHDGRR